MIFEDLGFEELPCCACGVNLIGQDVNIIMTEYIATWDFPVAPNLGMFVSAVTHIKCAVALFCNECIAEKQKILYVVEFTPEKTVILHPVKDLESVRTSGLTNPDMN